MHVQLLFCNVFMLPKHCCDKKGSSECLEKGSPLKDGPRRSPLGRSQKTEVIWNAVTRNDRKRCVQGLSRV